MRFIKVNKLKLIQVEFHFSHFVCVAANASELFYMGHLANNECYFSIQNFHFKHQILYSCKLASLSLRKSTQMREGAFSLGNE